MVKDSYRLYIIREVVSTTKCLLEISTEQFSPWLNCGLRGLLLGTASLSPLARPGSQPLPSSRIWRPSLTHIRFLLKWDFHCSEGAGSWISLPQPFPVSSQKGSAAMLHFLPSLASCIFSGTNLDWKACLCWSLDFQRRKKIAPEKKGGTLPLIKVHTNAQTHKQVHADFASDGSSERFAIMGRADMQSPATPKWSLPMVPQHVASFDFIVLCIQGMSEHAFGILEAHRIHQEQVLMNFKRICHLYNCLSPI